MADDTMSPLEAAIRERMGRAVRESELADIRSEAENRDQYGWSKEIEAGWEQAVGSTARTVGAFTGWDAANQYAEERSAEAAGLSGSSGYVQSLDDVHGVGDAVSWGAKQVFNAIPSVATLAVPAGAGVMVGRAGLGLAAAAGIDWAQQTGGNIDAQIEEGKEVNLFDAGAAGVAQTALDLSAGAGGKVLGKLGVGVRAGGRITEEATSRAGRLWQGRPGAALRTAAEEGVTEGAQQALEEAQRAHGAENYDMVAGQKRIIEATAAGAVAGAPFGGLLGDHGHAPTPREEEPAPDTRHEPTGPAPTPMTPGQYGDVMPYGEGPRPMTPGQYDAPSANEYAYAKSQKRIPYMPDRTDQLHTPQLEDRSGEAAPPEAVTPTSPLEDVFTGATPETLRPADISRVREALRGDEKASSYLVKISKQLNDALSKQDLYEAQKLVEGEQAKLDKQVEGTDASPISDAEIQLRSGVMQRAADLLSAYTRVRNGMETPPVGPRGLFRITPDDRVAIAENGDAIRAAIYNNETVIDHDRKSGDVAYKTPDYLKVIAANTIKMVKGLSRNPESFERAFKSRQTEMENETDPTRRDALRRQLNVLKEMRDVMAMKEEAKHPPLTQEAPTPAPAASYAPEPTTEMQAPAPTAEMQALKEAPLNQHVADAAIQEQIARQQLQQLGQMQRKQQAEQAQANLANEQGRTHRAAAMEKVRQNPNLYTPTQRESAFLKAIGKDEAAKGWQPGEREALAKYVAKEEKPAKSQAEPVQRRPRPEGMSDKDWRLAREADKKTERNLEAALSDIDAQREQLAKDQATLDQMRGEFLTRAEGLLTDPGFTKQYSSMLTQLGKNMIKVMEDTGSEMTKRISDAADILRSVKDAEAYTAAKPNEQLSLRVGKSVDTAPKPAVTEKVTPTPEQTEQEQYDLWHKNGEPNTSPKLRLDALKKRRTLNAQTKSVLREKLARHFDTHEGYDRELASEMVSLLENPKVPLNEAKENINSYLADPELSGTKKPRKAKRTVEHSLAPKTPDGFDEHEGNKVLDYAEKLGLPTPGENDIEHRDATPNEKHVADMVRKILTGWRNPPRIMVIDPEAKPINELAQELRESYLNSIRTRGGFPRASYIGNTPDGKPTVVIYATTKLPRAEVMARLFHEMLGHHGLRTLFGENILKAIDALDKHNEGFRRGLDAWIKSEMGQQYVKTLHNDRRLLAEEYFAQMAGDLGISNWAFDKAYKSWVEKLRTIVVNFLRKTGMIRPPVDLASDATITDLVARIIPMLRDDPAGSTQNWEAHGNAVFSTYRQNVNAAAAEKAAKTSRFGKRRTFASLEEDPSLVGQVTPEPYLGEHLLDTGKVRDFLDERNVPMGITNRITSMIDGIKSKNLGLMLGSTLVDHANSIGVKDYARIALVQQRERSIINEEHDKIDALMLASPRPRAERAALNAYMRDATTHGKWGYQPEWMKTPVTIDAKAKKISDDYKAAHPEGWKAADDMMKYAYESRKTYSAAVRKYINDDADEALQQEGLTPTEIKQVEEIRSRELKMFDKMVPEFDGPYFPLGRRGNFMAMAKSAELLEAEKNNDVKTQMELRQDPEHFALMFRDSYGEAEELKKQLAAEPNFRGGEVSHGRRTETFEQIGETPLMQMQKLKKMVESTMETSGMSKETVAHVNSLIKDMYVRALAENSARKYDRKRENVRGFDENMLRSYNDKLKADATALGFVSTYHQEMAMTKSMLDSVEANRGTGTNYADQKRLLHEVMRRRAVVMDQRNSQWNAMQDRFMTLSSFYHLATSPRYYLMNATQPLMFTAPLLGARYGLGKAWGTMIETYKQIAPAVKAKDFWKGSPNFDKFAPALKPDELEFLKHAQALGKLDFGIQLDAGMWDGESGISQGIKRANGLFRTVSSQLEFINRVSAGLSAYRLARDAGHAGAMDYGAEIIDKTQFNYSTENQPRYFNMLPKVITQFRKYQVGQLALQGSLIKNAVRAVYDSNMTSAEKKEAVAALAYSWAHVGVVAGAMGLPGAQIVGLLGSAIFKDQDEPLNGERWLRTLFGEGMGQYALRGVPLAAGLDLSGSVGLGTLWNPLPYADYTTIGKPGGLSDIAYQFGTGAAGGMVAKVAQPLFNGDGWGVANSVMPSGIRNLFKAYDLAVSGLEKKNGDLMLSKALFNELNVAAQAVGFQPFKASDAQTKYYEQKQFEDYYKDRTTQMKQAYIAAQKSQDSLAMRSVVDEWNRVQATKKRLGLKPTPLSQLYRAQSEKIRREKKISETNFAY